MEMRLPTLKNVNVEEYYLEKIPFSVQNAKSMMFPGNGLI
jgi:hypothetical protein